MSKTSYYTEEGLKKLKEELDQLKDIERPKASQAIADARDKGDLSENAEYDAAKEAQGMLEMRIAKMEENYANARLIDESQLDTSKVLVLSTVELLNKTNGMKMTYTLVAQSEADLKNRKNLCKLSYWTRAIRKKSRRNGRNKCSQWNHTIGNYENKQKLNEQYFFKNYC